MVPLIALISLLALGGCWTGIKPEFSIPVPPHPSGDKYEPEQAEAIVTKALGHVSSELGLGVPLACRLVCDQGGEEMTLAANGHVIEVGLGHHTIHDVVICALVRITCHEATEWALGSPGWLGGHLYDLDPRLRWVGDGAAEVVSHEALRHLFADGDVLSVVKTGPPPRDGTIDLSAWQLRRWHEPASEGIESEYRYLAARMLMERWWEAAKARGLAKPMAALYRYVHEPRTYDEVMAWLEQTSGLPLGEMARSVDKRAVRAFWDTAF